MHACDGKDGSGEAAGVAVSDVVALLELAVVVDTAAAAAAVGVVGDGMTLVTLVIILVNAVTLRPAGSNGAVHSLMHVASAVVDEVDRHGIRHRLLVTAVSTVEDDEVELVVVVVVGVVVCCANAAGKDGNVIGVELVKYSIPALGVMGLEPTVKGKRLETDGRSEEAEEDDDGDDGVDVVVVAVVVVSTAIAFIFLGATISAEIPCAFVFGKVGRLIFANTSASASLAVVVVAVVVLSVGRVGVVVVVGEKVIQGVFTIGFTCDCC